jgi:peptidoglycan-associated lipoprotein
MKKTFGLWLIAAAAVLLTSACAGTHASSKTGSAAQPAGSSLTKPENAALTEAARTADIQPDVRDANLRAVPELKTVAFAYDSDSLDEEARATLKSNAEWLKANSYIKVQVAGNCDQRGTTAYNLALGQKRADSVRSYYTELGVDSARIATISYGKERPLCSESAESCWSRNRRADTLEAVGAKVAAP